MEKKDFFLPSQKNYDIKESIHKKSKEILFIKNISYNIKNKNILNNINFKLFYGDCLGIVGESGSGKSTIAKIICGLINNYNGSVFFNKKIINKNEKKYKLFFKNLYLV